MTATPNDAIVACKYASPCIELSARLISQKVYGKATPDLAAVRKEIKFIIKTACAVLEIVDEVNPEENQ